VSQGVRECSAETGSCQPDLHCATRGTRRCTKKGESVMCKQHFHYESVFYRLHRHTPFL